MAHDEDPIEDREEWKRYLKSADAILSLQLEIHKKAEGGVSRDAGMNQTPAAYYETPTDVHDLEDPPSDSPVRPWVEAGKEIVKTNELYTIDHVGDYIWKPKHRFEKVPLVFTSEFHRAVQRIKQLASESEIHISYAEQRSSTFFADFGLEEGKGDCGRVTFYYDGTITTQYNRSVLDGASKVRAFLQKCSSDTTLKEAVAASVKRRIEGGCLGDGAGYTGNVHNSVLCKIIPQEHGGVEVTVPTSSSVFRLAKEATWEDIREHFDPRVSRVVAAVLKVIPKEPDGLRTWLGPWFLANWIDQPKVLTHFNPAFSRYVPAVFDAPDDLIKGTRAAFKSKRLKDFDIQSAKLEDSHTFVLDLGWRSDLYRVRIARNVVKSHLPYVQVLSSIGTNGSSGELSHPSIVEAIAGSRNLRKALQEAGVLAVPEDVEPGWFLLSPREVEGIWRCEIQEPGHTYGTWMQLPKELRNRLSDIHQLLGAHWHFVTRVDFTLPVEVTLARLGDRETTFKVRVRWDRSGRPYVNEAIPSKKEPALIQEAMGLIHSLNMAWGGDPAPISGSIFTLGKDAHTWLGSAGDPVEAAFLESRKPVCISMDQLVLHSGVSGASSIAIDWRSLSRALPAGLKPLVMTIPSSNTSLRQVHYEESGKIKSLLAQKSLDGEHWTILKFREDDSFDDVPASFTGECVVEPPPGILRPGCVIAPQDAAKEGYKDVYVLHRGTHTAVAAVHGTEAEHKAWIEEAVRTLDMHAVKASADLARLDFGDEELELISLMKNVNGVFLDVYSAKRDTTYRLMSGDSKTIPSTPGRCDIFGNTDTGSIRPLQMLRYIDESATPFTPAEAGETLEAQCVIGTQEIKNMSENTKPLVNRIIEEAKDNMSEASIRIAARQIVKLVQEPLASLIAGPDTSAETRQAVAAFLKSDGGKLLIMAATGGALSAALASGKLGTSDASFVNRLTHELRVAALTEGGDQLAELVMAPLRQVLTSLTLPSVPPVEDPAQLPSPVPSSSSMKAEGHRSDVMDLLGDN